MVDGELTSRSNKPAEHLQGVVLEGKGRAPEQLEDVSVAETDHWGDLLSGRTWRQPR